MKDIIDKIKKVKPLIVSKEATFNQEVALLNQLSYEKMEALGQLRSHQNKYMKGVDQINQERQNGKFDRANILEPALDYVKQKWHESLRQVQKIEKRQEAQRDKVFEAQRELKSIEALRDRYEKELKIAAALQEQKELDEMAQNMRRRDQE